MNRKLFSNVVLGVLAVLTTVIFLNACEIGLGPSVDTEAPKVEIKYPKASVTIRDEFIFHGTCSDDKAVTKITATVLNTKTNVSYGPYEATITNGTSWDVKLNQPSTAETATNGWTFPDGKYEVSVVAYDASGHNSGSTSRAYEIDNSAPVFVITSPGATTLDSATGYGSTFNVKGTIADDHNIDSASITVYSDAGTLIGTYTENDIATAGGTSVNFARYVANGTSDLNTRYTQMYGSDTLAGTKKFYCTVSLTDSAKQYIDPSEDDDSSKTNTTTGNTTSTVYLYDDVYTSYMSAKKGYGLEANDFKDVLNGTLTGTISRTATSIEASKLLSVLKELAKDTSSEAARLTFSLNPDANPRYIVNGYMLSFSEKNDSLLKTSFKLGTRNQNVTIIAKAGLDGTLIDPNTLKVYMAEYKSFEDMVEPDSGLMTKAVSEFISDPTTVYTKAVDSGTTNISLIKDNSEAKASSSEQYSLTLALPETISSDKFYVIAVSGKDVDDTELVGEGSYGFLGNVSGAPPVVTITAPVDLSYTNNSSTLTYTGTASSETSEIESVIYSITVTDEITNDSVGTISGEATLVNGNWTFNPSNGDGYDKCKNEANAGHQYMYAAKITAYDETGNPGSSTVNIHIDSLGPTVTINSITPIVEVSGKYYVNGIIPVIINVNEASLNDVTYTVYVDGVATGAATSIGAVYSYTDSVDTTKFADGKTFAIVYTATDKAGNTGSYSTSEYNKVVNGKETAFIIDQSTNYPVITPTNANEALTTVAQIKNAYKNGEANTNIFGTTVNNKISYALTDDDGISAIAVQYKLVSDTNYSEWKDIPITGTPPSCTINYTLPPAEGLYQVVLKVTDKTSANTPTTSVTTKGLVVAVDAGAPTIKVTSPSEGSYCSPNFTIAGSITDKNATMIAPVCYYYSEDGSTKTQITDGSTYFEAGTPTVNTTNGTWTTLINAHSSHYYHITFAAEDVYGQTGEVDFTFKVDQEPPTFTITKLGNETLTTALKENNETTRSVCTKKDTWYTVEGTVTDTGSSGVGNFMYYKIVITLPEKVGSGDTEYFDLSSGWNSVTISKGTTNTWSAMIDMSDDAKYNDATDYYVCFATTDAAGNVSCINKNPSKCLTIKADNKAPIYTALSLNGVSDGSTVKITGTNTNAVFSATGVSDDCSGINSVYLYENDTTNYPMTLSSGTYTKTIANGDLTTGTHKYYVRITDKVGNVSTVKIYATLAVDKTKPEMSISSVTPVTTSSKMNGTVTVTAIAKDETGLDKSQWVINDGTSDLTAEGTFGTIECTNELYNNFTFTIDTTKITTGNGPYKLKMWAVDAAGNISTVATYLLPIDQSTDIPVISLSNASTEVTVANKTNGNLFDTTSNNKLLGVVTDDDGIASITVNVYKDSETTPKATSTLYPTGTTYSLSYELPSEEGKYKVDIIAYDTIYSPLASDVIKALRSKKATYYVAVDKGAPTFSDTAVSAAVTNAAVTVSGKITEALLSSTDGFVVKGTLNGTTTSFTPTSTIYPSSADGALSSKPWSFVVPNTIGDGKWVFTITATDAVGYIGTTTATTTIDTTPPTATGLGITADSGNYSTYNSEVYFKSSLPINLSLTSTDSGTNASGVSKVTYIAVSGNYTAYDSGASYTYICGSASEWASTAQNGTTTWKTTVSDFVGKTDGQYTIFARATDAAGNTTATPAVLHVVADGTAPVLSETDSIGAYMNGAFTLTYTASDAISLSTVGSTCVVTSGDTTETGEAIANVSGTSYQIAQTVPADNANHYSYTYTYTVTATDRAGNKTTLSNRSVSIDRTPPTATIDAVTTPNNKVNYTLTGTALDALSGLNVVQVWLDTDTYATATTKTTVTPNASNVWSWPVYGLAEGSHTIHCYATDKATNATTAGTQTFTVDTTAPATTWYTSAGTLYTSTGSTENTTYGSGTAMTAGTTHLTKTAYTLKGAITDANKPASWTSDYVTMSVKKDGSADPTGTFTLGTDGVWTYAYATKPADGTYVYTLTLKDAANNSATSVLTVLVDATGPVLSVTAPSSGAVLTTGSLAIAGVVSDTGCGINTVSYVIYDAAGTGVVQASTNATIDGGNWNAAVTLASQASLNVQVTAKDKLGTETTSAMIPFYYDKDAPSFTSHTITTTAVTGTVYNTTALAVKATVTDAVSGVASVMCSTDNTSWSTMVLASGEYTATVALTEGSGKEIYFKATDKAALSTTESITSITVDTSAPTITGVSASDSTVSSSDNIAQIYLNASVLDSISGTSKVWITKGTDNTELKKLTPAAVTSTITYNSTSGLLIPSTSLTEGSNIFYVHASDTAGNTSVSSGITIVVDTVVPTLTLSNLSANKVIALADVTNTSGTYTYKISGSWSDATTGTKVLQYTTSGTPASVTATSTSDADAATSWVTISGAQQVIGATATWTKTVTVTEGAGKTFSFRAQDEAGNWSSNTGATFAGITFDFTKPTLSFTTVTGATLTNSVYYVKKSASAQTLSVTATAVDNLGMGSTSNVTASATLNGTTVETGTKNLIVTKTLSSATTVTVEFKVTIAANDTTDDGVWVFTLNGFDAAGQSGTAVTRSVTVDTIVPAVSITNLANNADVYGDAGTYKAYLDTANNNYSLRGTWSDASGTGTNTLSYAWGTGAYTAFTGTASVTAEKSFIVDLPVTQGTNLTLKIKATDVAGNESAVTSFTGIDIDYAVPTLSNITVNPYVGYDGTLSLSGTIEDSTLLPSATPYGVSIAATKNGTSAALTNFTLTPTQSSTTKTTFTLTRAAGTAQAYDGRWVFTVTATDAAGRTATATSSACIVDTTKPAMASLTLGGKTYSTTNYYSETSLKVEGTITEMSGTATDGSKGSGIDAIYYYIGTTAPASLSGYTGSFSPSTVSTTSPYATSFSTAISGFSNGKSLFLLPVDKAGNAATSATAYLVNIDQSTPTVSTFTADGVSVSGTVLTNAMKSITIAGKASDDNGVSSVEVKVAGYSGTTLKDASPANRTYNSTDQVYDYTWTVTVPVAALADGRKMTATATDVAGNTSTTEICTLVVDTTAPTYAVSSSVSDLNGKSTIRGTVTEDKTLSSLELYYSVNNSGTYSGSLDYSGGSSTNASDTPATYGWTKFGTTITSASNIYNWSFADFDFSTLSGAANTTNGIATIYILPVVKDEAGNCNAYTMSYDGSTTTYAWDLDGAATTCSVDLNKDRPVINISNIGASGETLKFGTNSQITGTVSDDDSTSTKVVSTFLASSTALTSISMTKITASGNVQVVSYDADEGKYGTKQIAVTPSSTNVVYKGAAVTASYVDADSATHSYTGYDIIQFNPTTGDWTFTPYNVSDGAKTIYFYIVDNTSVEEGSTTNVFYTNKAHVVSSTETHLSMPNLKYRSGTATDNATAVTYKSDSESPNTPSITGYWGATEVAAKTHINSGENMNYIAAFSSGISLGGTSKKYLQFVVTSNDASGIKAMTLTATDTSGNTICSLSTATPGDNTSFSATSAAGTCTWVTRAVDLSTYKVTGQVTIKAVVTDGAGLYNNASPTFTLDYTGPTISVNSPDPNDEVTASISVTGSTSDEGGAGVSSIAWLVPNKTQQNITDAASLAALGTWQNEISSGTVLSWTFKFDDSDATKHPLLEKYDENAGNTGNDDTYYKAVLSGGIYTLPMYFLAYDTLGNYTVNTAYTMKHNPDANRPTTILSYPSSENYDSGKQYVTLGGTIRANGSATDLQTRVSTVYMQIDWDGDGDFDDYSATSGDAYNANSSGYYTVKSAATATEITSGWKKEGSKTAAEVQAAWWGIAATATTGKTVSWAMNLNANSELNPTDSFNTEGIPLADIIAAGRSPLRKIAIRACAVDSEGNVGAWSDTTTIMIDDTAPRIGTYQKAVLRNYTSGLGATITTAAASTTYITANNPVDEKDYSSSNFLAGTTWYLVTTIEDETGISRYAVKNETTETTLVEGTGYYVGKKYAIGVNADGTNATTRTGYFIYVPISTTSSISITAEDGTHTSMMTYNISMDNTAPSITSVTGNGTELDSGAPVAVVNSNYKYTLGGKITDEGSGASRVLFYFMRDADTDRIYDPVMKAQAAAVEDGTSATTTARVNVSAATYAATTNGLCSMTAGSNTLYGITYTGTRSTTTTFTYADISSNKHIRKGGLIYIGDAYRLITAKSGTTVTFEPAAPVTNTKAFFPYAQSVDSNDETAPTDWSKTTTTNGIVTLDGLTETDGDEMYETFAQTGTQWAWSAATDTSLITDGPITIYVFAIDECGNISSTSYTTSGIANNPPRLAKVFLGTDLNADTKYSDTEFSEYDMYHVAGGYQSAYTLTTANYKVAKLVDVDTDTWKAVDSNRKSFKIVDTLAVVPEFTGGNNSVGVVFTRGATSATAVTGTPVAAGASTTYSISTGNTTVPSTKGLYWFTNTQITGVAVPTQTNDGTTAMSFTFWDKTEECTYGTNSQNCVLYVPDFNVDITDGVVPKTVVKPFTWTAEAPDTAAGLAAWQAAPENYNSIYGGNRKYGHIELADDWKLTAKYLNSGSPTTSGEYDADPKVSGKITIRGTAYDDQRITSLYIRFDEFTPTITASKTAASSKAFGSTTYYLAATFNSATAIWTCADASMDTNSWHFSVDSSEANGAYFGQDGHYVIWQLDIDTSKISNYAGADKNIRVIALDKNSNQSAITTTATADVTTNNVPFYQMDVVPYIAKVYTTLAAQKKTNWSVFNRTALGHYPVYYTDGTTAETITIYGFNFSGTFNGTYPTYNSQTTTITVSGEYSLPTVQSMVSLNNYNKNTAEYNKLPNSDNNNLLTDDVVFDVWQITPKAVQPYGGSGVIKEPVMKINPSNDIVGFAFANGVDKFSMSNGTTSSYTYWLYNYADYGEVAFTYDDKGYSHGIVIGHDTQPSNGYTGRMNYITSKWGVPQTGDRDNFYYYGKLRMESCGVPSGAYVNGTTAGSTVIDITRFQSPSIAATSHGTADEPTLYLAYYDNIQQQIRFRWGTNTVASRNNNPTTNYYFNQFYDEDSASGRNRTDNNAYGEHVVFEAKVANYSLVAGDENDATGNTDNSAGKYVALAVIPGTNAAGANGDIVPIVWYDGSKLMYTYRYGTKDDTNASSAGVTGKWSVPLEIFPESGISPAITVAKNGSIHIAAYNKLDGALMYAYLPTYSCTQAQVKTCIVDNYMIVGDKVSIDTVDDGNNNAIPYISYYMTSMQKPKVAYLVDPTATDKAPAGVDDQDLFTGSWEITMIPTTSDVNEDRINIGLWKNATTGVIRASTSSKTVSNGTSTGIVVGNKTAHPIIGYATTLGTANYIETAQMK